MKKNLLIVLSPFIAAAVFWFADTVLTNVLRDREILRRLISAVGIMLTGFLVAQSYIRLWRDDRQSVSSIQQLSRENESNKVEVSQLEHRVVLLTADLDATRKAARRAEENIDILGVIVVITDSEGIVRFVNRKACQVLAYAKEDVIGMKFYDNFVPESVRDFARAQARKLASGDPAGERDYTGMLFDRHGEERVIVWHHSVIRGENGQAIALLSAGEDITKHVEDESLETERQVRQSRARRMEAIAMFASGVADRLSGTLEHMHNTTEILTTASSSSSQSDVRRQIETVSSALKEAKALMTELQSASGAPVTEMSEVNLNAVVRTCLSSSDLSVLQEANLTVVIKTELANDLLPVSGSEEHLVKALFGLLARAMTSMPGGGRLVISTKNLHVGEGLVKYEAIPPGDYAVVWVVDEGKEIDEKCLDRIFEPFGCPDQAKAGPLSLAATYGIVKAHKGFVNAKSEAGLGTEFALCIPVTWKHAGADDRVSNLPRGTEGIMVVDDSEQDCVVAKRLLEKLGYKVTVASHGREALKIFRDSKGKPSPFDLMLLDMIMGEDFDGLDTYREVLKLFPKQKCIIVSGHGPSDRTQEAFVLGASQFIAKPYTLEGLAKAIRDELDQKS